MVGKIPPHNEEAEKSVLGAALLSKDALYDVIEHVRASDFYSSLHQEIFEAVWELYQKNSPIDTLTVSEELKKRNSLEMVGGRAYIAALSMDVPSTLNAAEYAKIVAEKSTLRQLISAAGEIVEKGYQEKTEAELVIDFAEQSIFEISQQRQAKDYAALRDVLLENLNIIDKASSMEGGITGVTSGFADIDDKTAGFQKSDLIVLAARPAMGKTAFALNVARHAAIKARAKVIVFSLEMSREQLGQRLLAIESRIELQRLKTGNLTQQHWDQVQEAMDQLAPANIYIDDTPGITITEIKSKCRRLKAEKGLDLILVDYLQLMNYESKAENRQQEITALSRAFKQLARELDCPVIVLSQLSRAPEQRSGDAKRPILSDLRESGSIEQDADIVLFLYRDEYYNPDTEDKNICEVIISKHRSGPTGTVKLTWMDKYTKFGDMSKIGK
ncbi:MAG: replicative DNA helicase [Clostridiales bacterium]|nr:replicative DNA helicase [Clostridiales bacterium]